MCSRGSEVHTDYIGRDTPLVCWAYAPITAPATHEHTWPWAMAPVVLQLFRALFDQRHTSVSFDAWAQFDSLHSEYVLGIQESIVKSAAGVLIRQHLGSAKAKQPGPELRLLQAPCRVPLLLNKQLVPVLRYQCGWLISYGDREPLLRDIFHPAAGISTIYRQWVRADRTIPEQYGAVPGPATALQPDGRIVEIGRSE